MKRVAYHFVVFVLVSFFILTFSSFSVAEPIYATKEPVEIYHPFYIGAFGAWVIPDELVLKDEYSTKYKFNFDNSWGAGAKFGYIFPFKWMAAELEYMYLDDQNVDNPGTLYYKANNVMANLILRYPYGMIRPYIGAGLGWSWADLGNDAANDSIDMDALAWQGLAGINLEIIPNLSLDIGYRYFMSKYDIDKVMVTGGLAAPVTRRLTEATMADHMIIAGLNFHFGGSKPVPPPPPPELEPLPLPAPIVEDKDCDNDGVPDSRDKCFCDTPLGCIVDENGCPIDSDKDGVCDGRDKCPNTPEGCAVDEDGCPLDSDKDGVIDCRDKCPDTPEIAKVDENGCPYMAIIRLTVQFDYDKSIVKPEFYENIKQLGDFMKRHPNLDATIEGHTDNIASAKYNLALSKRRADAVKKVLVERENIDPKRLSTVGYGFTRPVATNDTPEGRYQNRRVQALLEAQATKK